MARKLLAILLVIMMMAALVACGEDDDDEGSSRKKKSDKVTPSTEAVTGDPTEDPTPTDGPDITGPAVDGSRGLEYTESGSGDSIAILGMGSCTDKNVVIPDTIDGKPVTVIGPKAFHQNYTIESVTLPDSIVRIEKSAFEQCHALKTINLPDSIEKIESRAFYGAGLTEVTIPANVKNIESSTFEKCVDLTAVHTSGNLKQIGDEAFRGCTSLVTVELVEGLQQIRSEAFHECSALKRIEIPDTVSTIDDWAFRDCTSLESVKLPKQLRTLEYAAFMHCFNLKEVTLPANADYFKIVGKCLIDIPHRSASLVWDGGTLPTDGSIRMVFEYLYYDDESLTEITIPEGVEEIGADAFCGCRNLTKVVLPASLTEINNGAFEGTGITEITISDNVKNVFGGVFAASSLEKAYIGAGATKSLVETFKDCKNLKECTIIGQDNVYLDKTFSGCESLTGVTLGKSVNLILPDTFKDCGSLKEITYQGTKQEWQAVEKRDGWDGGIEGRVIHCTDGDL